MLRELLDFVMNSDAFRMEEFPATIGRSCDATIQLNDRFASRVHCLIERNGERFYVIDLNSHHGTRLNDQEVSHAEIKPGDQLRIGLHVFRVNQVRQKLLFRRTHDGVYHSVSSLKAHQGGHQGGDLNVNEPNIGSQDDGDRNRHSKRLAADESSAVHEVVQDDDLSSIQAS